MRKNVRNDKVVRAITIGLATMIAATSMPVTAFANDEAPAAEAPAEAPAPAAAEAPAETPAPAAAEAPAETPAETQSEAPAPAAEEAAPAVEESAPAPAAESETPAPVVETPAETPAEIGTIVDIVGEIEAAAGTIGEHKDGETTAVADGEAKVENCLPAIDNAQNVVDEALTKADKAVVDENGKTIPGRIDEAEGEVETVKRDLKTAKEEYGKASDNINTGAFHAEKAQAAVDDANAKIDEYNKAAGEADGNAGSAITDANTANTTDSEKEAFAAQAKAIAEAKNAEEGLKAATDAYNVASEKAKEIEEEYNIAKDAYDNAEKNVDEAEKKVAKAKTNAAEAQNNLAQAKRNLEKLYNEKEKLADQYNEIVAVKDQYDAYMVQYFRQILGDNVVVDKNGNLDVSKCAEKVTPEQIAEEAKANRDNLFKLGRYLLEQMVTYVIMNEENVDPKSILFGVEEKGSVGGQVGQKGIIYTNGQSKPQVAFGIVTDKDGNTVTAGETKKYFRTNSNQGDAGRTNRFKVTYNVKIKDEDGNEKVEERSAYYNYVRKSPDYDQDKDENGNIDLTKGAFYLEKIEYDETAKKWVATRVKDNNLDDYSKLAELYKEAEEAKKVKADYEEAIKAVENARNEVKELQAELDKIKDLTIDRAKVDDLKKELDKAQDKLQTAKENKDNLEKKVDDARKAVAAIDLSRFNPKPSTGGDSTQAPAAGETDVTTPSADAPAAATVIDAGSYTVTIPAALSGVDFSIFGGTAATVTAPAAGGVAGVREDAAGEIGGGVIEEAGEENEEGSEETVNPAEENIIKNIDDVKVPLAAAPPIEEGLRINWWWFLVILLLGETGKKLYDDHMMKVRVREEADRIS